MPDVTSTPPHPGRPPWPVFLSLVAGALLMHLGVIDSLPSSQAPRDAAAPPVLLATGLASGLQVRTLPPPSASLNPTRAGLEPAARPRATTTPERDSAPVVLPPSRGPASAVNASPKNFGAGKTSAGDALEPLLLAAVAAPVAATPALVDPTPSPRAAAEPVPPLTAAPGATGPVPDAAGWAGDDGEIPVYRTLLPAPFTLSYSLDRGLMTGSGELSWRLTNGRYELRLSGRLAGLTLLNQVSSGGVDPAGIAPMRFTDKRLRGGVQAANFQRDAGGRSGKITFSGPSVSYPLRPGVQDRLSWMVQLPAIVQAEPQRLAEGQRISIPVVGARGDADIWVFSFRAWDVVQTPAGAVRAARFSREPRGPYDTQVEVWLDPALHHLPVRARLSHAPDGDTLELLRL